MRMKNKILGAVAALPLAGVALFGAAASASAESAPPCPVGYVCVELSTSAIDYIPQGATRTYSPSVVMLSAINATNLDYCVTGNPSFALQSFWSRTATQTISSVAPGSVCAS
ncbi:hypothetical protein [Spongiactinospora sp. TRM90649]|uniref:hypothetical protein n=1 Tax=Spongiactinospora sp. TRM90649 TaxID=3031114 RepID=UPI0023F9F114|nr:hypothetical protein [Spongiactinospora sp. TRM90649]MDF5758347.1 hypothetical protein [Spongiactinospora sp. TRM90649]